MRRACRGGAGASGLAVTRDGRAAATPNLRRRPRQLFHPRSSTRIGDYVRNEIATGKIPGAVLLIQQHGKPVYFESFGVRDVATAHCR